MLNKILISLLIMTSCVNATENKNSINNGFYCNSRSVLLMNSTFNENIKINNNDTKQKEINYKDYDNCLSDHINELKKNHDNNINQQKQTLQNEIENLQEKINKEFNINNINEESNDFVNADNVIGLYNELDIKNNKLGMFEFEVCNKEIINLEYIKDKLCFVEVPSDSTVVKKQENMHLKELISNIACNSCTIISLENYLTKTSNGKWNAAKKYVTSMCKDNSSYIKPIAKEVISNCKNKLGNNAYNFLNNEIDNYLESNQNNEVDEDGKLNTKNKINDNAKEINENGQFKNNNIKNERINNKNNSIEAIEALEKQYLTILQQINDICSDKERTKKFTDQLLCAALGISEKQYEDNPILFDEKDKLLTLLEMQNKRISILTQEGQKSFSQKRTQGFLKTVKKSHAYVGKFLIAIYKFFSSNSEENKKIEDK